MTTLAAVLTVGLVSYLLRLGPWLVLERLEISPRTDSALRYAGVGAVSALFVGSLLHVASDAASGSSLLPLAAAVAVSGAGAWRRWPGIVVVCLGMGVFLGVAAVVD